MTKPNIKVFISHSSADLEIAKALIELLRDAMPALIPAAIRCTSVPGYKLQGGANTDNQLREEMRDAPIFLGVLTKQSLASTYVLFELGARWGAQSQFTPLLAAGLLTSDLKPPLAGLHAQSCESETDLHQMLYEIAELLKLALSGAHVYNGRLKKLVELSIASVGSSQVNAGLPLGLSITEPKEGAKVAYGSLLVEGIIRNYRDEKLYAFTGRPGRYWPSKRIIPNGNRWSANLNLGTNTSSAIVTVAQVSDELANYIEFYKSIAKDHNYFGMPLSNLPSVSASVNVKM